MNFIVLGIAFNYTCIIYSIMNPFLLTKYVIACFALHKHPPLDSRNILLHGPWQMVETSTPFETHFDYQSTDANEIDQWTMVDRPPELDNCADGYQDVTDDTEEQKQEFVKDPFHTLERPNPSRGQYGISSEEIEKHLNNAGLPYEVLPEPKMSPTDCAKQSVIPSWKQLKKQTIQKAPELFKAALGMKTAYNSVQGMSSIAIPTSLEALPGTVSSIGQVAGSCASAYSLAPTVAKNLRDIFVPASELSSCIWVIGREQAKESYHKYAPSFQRNCAVLQAKAGSVTRSLKHGFHRFTSRR